MAITWGTCGHPLRDGGRCVVCALVGMSSDLTAAFDRDDNEARGLDRVLAVTRWCGREDEANAWEDATDAHFYADDLDRRADLECRDRVLDVRSFSEAVWESVGRNIDFGRTFRPVEAIGALPGVRYDPATGRPRDSVYLRAPRMFLAGTPEGGSFPWDDWAHDVDLDAVDRLIANFNVPIEDAPPLTLDDIRRAVTLPSFRCGAMLVANPTGAARAERTCALFLGHEGGHDFGAR